MQLAPPPRALRAPLQFQLLFGSVPAVVGWGFLALGLIFVHVFCRGLSPAELLRWRGEVAVTRGEVVASDYLNASENEVYIQRVGFVFVAADGHRYEGTSYVTRDEEVPLGPAAVEYLPDQPEHARLQGMRTSVFSPAVLFVAISPGIGAGLALFALARGLKARDLLINGRMAEGTLVDRQPTNTRVNGQRVFVYTFRFDSPMGEQLIKARTHAGARARDEATERILYDPGRPGRAVVFDLLPGSPVVLPDGTFQARSTARALASGLLPAATLLVHGAIYLALR